jgi:tetratricopeptide (TPR) repeat protein
MYNLSLALRSNNQDEEADKVLDKAVQFGINADVRALCDKAERMTAVKNWIAGIYYSTLAIRKNPLHIPSRIILSQCLRRVNKKHEAYVICMQGLVEINPNDADLLVEAAYACIVSNRTAEEALILLDRAEQLGRDDAEVNGLRAMLLDGQEARKYALRALQQNPTEEFALLVLKRLESTNTQEEVEEQEGLGKFSEQVTLHRLDKGGLEQVSKEGDSYSLGVPVKAFLELGLVESEVSQYFQLVVQMYQMTRSSKVPITKSFLSKMLENIDRVKFNIYCHRYMDLIDKAQHEEARVLAAFLRQLTIYLSSLN